jgi:hypothetical protein
LFKLQLSCFWFGFHINFQLQKTPNARINPRAINIKDKSRAIASRVE